MAFVHFGQRAHEVQAEALEVDVVLSEARPGEGGHGVHVGNTVLDIDLTYAGDAGLLVDELELEGFEIVRQREVFVVKVFNRFIGKIFVVNI